MQQLIEATNIPSPTREEDSAALLMEVVPMAMRFIRSEMRSRRMKGLSIPQFRTLVFLYRHEGASLSEAANHVGLTLSSASKTIDALVRRKLVVRGVSSSDRRYVCLKLSKLGSATLSRARTGTEASLAKRLESLSPSEREMIVASMRALRPVFAPADISRSR